MSEPTRASTLDEIRDFLRAHLIENVNESGGVIGYKLILDTGETQAFWRLCDTEEQKAIDRYEDAKHDAEVDARLEAEEES